MLQLLLRRCGIKGTKPTVTSPAAAGEIAQGELWLNNNHESPGLFARADDDTLIEFKPDLPFLRSAASATPRSVMDKLGDVVSVKDFGAVGNGHVDDSDAIQAAITHCSTGKQLWIPGGTYKVTKTLVVPEAADISIRGDGREFTLIRMDAGSYTDHTLMKVGGVTHVTYSFSMEGVGLLCTEAAAGALGAEVPVVGLHLARNSHATLRNLTISGFDTNLRLQAAARCVFSALFFNNMGRSRGSKAKYAIHLCSVNAGQYSCTGLHFTDIEVFATLTTSSGADFSAFSAAVYNEDCDGAYFNNCHFIGSDRSYQAHVNSNGVVGAIRFANCYFDQFFLRGIELGGLSAATGYKLNDHVFTGCYFRGGQSGSGAHVYVGTALRVRMLQFSNCVFSDCQDQAIKTLGTSNVGIIQITGSTFNQCNKAVVGTAHCISVKADTVAITGNVFDTLGVVYKPTSTSKPGSVNGVPDAYMVYLYSSPIVYNVSHNTCLVQTASATAAGRAVGYIPVPALPAGATSGGGIKADNTWIEA